MRNPRFATADGHLRTFDIVTANPMWNQTFPTEVYDNDPHHRFTLGTPPRSSADWGWVQHMHASLNDDGRMAVVLDTGAVSRGSGNTGSNKERDIRKAFVDADLVEAVLLLPENLFYNTSAPGIIIVLNRAKPKEHKNKILLINASQIFSKGDPKNYISDDGIDRITSAYLARKKKDKLSIVVSKAEIVKKDYNISPSRYIHTSEAEEFRPPGEIVDELDTLETEAVETNATLRAVLKKLGV